MEKSKKSAKNVLTKNKSVIYYTAYQVIKAWYKRMWQLSSVGRAMDWKSMCPRFDPGSGHHFCFNSLIYNDLCIENTRKTRVFFRFKFSVWRIWRTRERHKAAKILRLGFPGDTAFMLKIGWFFAFQVEKNKSPTIFLWIKTLRSLCPWLFYLNTFVLNQQ